MSSDYLRKIHQLQKKYNLYNKQLTLEIDLILDGHPKADWTMEDWTNYYNEERAKGNKVIYLSSKFNTGT